MGGRLTRFVDELRRRKVLASAAWYLGVAFVTMQVVEAVFPYLPLEDPDLAGSIVLAVLAIGFPIAMGLSWVLEMTPPRLRRELALEELRPDDVGTPDASEPPARPELRPDAVAVLPFENLSDDPENAYFSDGITDDIIQAAAHVKGLRVLCRTSVMQYKGVNRLVAEIAGELGVGSVVTGSVRRSGTRIRIVAEVVDAVNDDHLWSDTYDRELGDIFEIQSEVAALIAEAVERELTRADRSRIVARGTNDPDAYDLYLRARFLWNQRNEVAVGECIRYLERALEHDPDFALALSGLAEAHVVLGLYGASHPHDAMEAARGFADRALSIDADLGEAVAARACVSAVFDWEWARAERDFQRALELAPSYPTAHQWHALHTLVPQRRFEDAFEALRKASELDPASSAIAVSRGIVRLYQRDYAGAAAEFEGVTALHPRFSLAYFFLGQCYGLLGDSERELAAHARGFEFADESPEPVAAHAHALARAGRADEAEETLARLELRARKHYVPATSLAQILIGLDRLDEALDRLDEAAEARATELIWIGVRPIYDPLRASPRFQALLARLSLTPPDAGATDLPGAAPASTEG